MDIQDAIQSNHEDLARITVCRMKAELESGRSPSITQIVELIREVTYRFDSISVQQLGEAVGHDVAAMSRVLNVAHTLGYNPEGIEISTINHAIHVIGFNKVRNLAISLMLTGNATSVGSADKRSAAALALASGLIAQTMRYRSGQRDGEEAFVCAALRNYGRILMANFFPEPYRKALKESKIAGADAAFRHAFGLTPLELSRSLLGQTRMSSQVVQNLREVTPAMKLSESPPAEMELPMVAEFSLNLCLLIQSRPLTVESFASHALRLSREFGSLVALPDEDELFGILSDVNDLLRTFASAFNSRFPDNPLLTRIQALSKKQECTGLSETSGIEPRHASKEEPGTSHQPDALSHGIAEIMKLERRNELDFDQVYAIGLRAIHQGLEFAHTLLLLRNEVSGKYYGWKGIGDLFMITKNTELLAPGSRDIFNVCLKHGEDVLIQNPADPKIQPFVPEWLRPAAGGQPLVLLPVRDGSGTYAIFCGLRGENTAFQLSVRQSQRLRSLRNRMAPIRERSSNLGA